MRHLRLRYSTRPTTDDVHPDLLIKQHDLDPANDPHASGVNEDQTMTETPDWLAAPSMTRGQRLLKALTAGPKNVERPQALTIVGELILISGVLVTLFLAWQLVWTDVVADHKQAQIVANLEWDLGVAEPAQPADTLADANPEPADPTDSGTTIAVMRIPRFGEDYVRPISEGVDKKTVLDTLGIGHYPDSAMPGKVGNFAVAGHRTTYGKPLNRIAELRVGDEITVDTPEAQYVYKVTSHEIVAPTQSDVVAPVPGHVGVTPTQRLITLTACHPMYSAKQRYIVHGELDRWTPKTNLDVIEGQQP